MIPLSEACKDEFIGTIKMAQEKNKITREKETLCMSLCTADIFLDTK
jgi:hypothetical protein